jgi:TatD DNase family protein
MLFIDTHTHLFSASFDQDREAVVARAIAAGVSQLLLPNIDKNSIQAMLDLADRFPENCLPMMGLHPGSVESDYIEQLAIHRAWFDQRPFVAVGEIGIDLYWRQDNLAAQTDAFLTQVGWAQALDLPVVIHSRESTALLLDLLAAKQVRGVFHCFSGSAEEAQTIVDRGMYIGLGGVLTYKNNEALREVVKKIPLDRILLETDSPYLAPVPYRGKRNESSYLVAVAETLCTIFGKGMDEIAATTTRNAQQLFRL